MPTASTDWGSVRNTMALAIEALTPTVLTDAGFRTTQTEQAHFADYVVTSPASVFREFDIVPGGTTFPSVEDSQIQRRETEFTIAVAYPHLWALYDTGGLQLLTKRYRNYHSMLAIVEADMNSIMRAVCRRGAANYASGQHAALESGWAPEDLEGVTLGVITGTAIYYYDAS